MRGHVGCSGVSQGHTGQRVCLRLSESHRARGSCGAWGSGSGSGLPLASPPQNLTLPVLSVKVTPIGFHYVKECINLLHVHVYMLPHHTYMLCNSGSHMRSLMAILTAPLTSLLLCCSLTQPHAHCPNASALEANGQAQTTQCKHMS